MSKNLKTPFKLGDVLICVEDLGNMKKDSIILVNYINGTFITGGMISTDPNGKISQAICLKNDNSNINILNYLKILFNINDIKTNDNDYPLLMFPLYSREELITFHHQMNALPDKSLDDNYPGGANRFIEDTDSDIGLTLYHRSKNYMQRYDITLSTPVKSDVIFIGNLQHLREHPINVYKDHVLIGCTKISIEQIKLLKQSIEAIIELAKLKCVKTLELKELEIITDETRYAKLTIQFNENKFIFRPDNFNDTYTLSDTYTLNVCDKILDANKKLVK